MLIYKCCSFGARSGTCFLWPLSSSVAPFSRWEALRVRPGRSHAMCAISCRQPLCISCRQPLQCQTGCETRMCIFIHCKRLLSDLMLFSQFYPLSRLPLHSQLQKGKQDEKGEISPHSLHNSNDWSAASVHTSSEPFFFSREMSSFSPERTVQKKCEE